MACREFNEHPSPGEMGWPDANGNRNPSEAYVYGSKQMRKFGDQFLSHQRKGPKPRKPSRRVRPRSAKVIACDASRLPDGLSAVAVTHAGEIVATSVFRARSTERAELRGLALAAQYAKENRIAQALFLCDSLSVVTLLRKGKLTFATEDDHRWLQLFEIHEGWKVAHAHRSMVHGAHVAARAAIREAA